MALQAVMIEDHSVRLDDRRRPPSDPPRPRDEAR